MKSLCTAIAITIFILATGGGAAAEFPVQKSRAQDEQQGLRCRRLQRAVQMVVASDGYDSPRLSRSSATARRPRRVIRDVVGYSVKSNSVGRNCFRCITGQVRHRVPLAKQEACGIPDLCGEGESCPICSHDVCDAGAALDSSCDACTTQICSIDPYCCDTLWSEDCVAKVETICGDTCGAPLPTTSTTTPETTSSTLLVTTTSLSTSTTTLSDPPTTLEPVTTTTTTTLPPIPGGADDCTDLIDFEGLPAGTVVAQVTTARGKPVVVKGTNPRFDCKKNAAIIYDSACSTGKRCVEGQCSGDDPDLGTPNEDFGGPGEGEGGRRGRPYQNAEAQGNLLIIAENLRDADSDDLVDEPDDQGGETIIHELDFSAFAPTVVRGLTLVDVENVEQPASIEIFDVTGASLGRFPVPATGNNGVARIDLPAVPGVWKLIVTLRGSSAIDDIRLGCVGDGTTTTTTTEPATTTSTSTTTLPTAESNACNVTFSVDNTTTAFALQFEADHSSRPGGFPNDACTVVPEGLVDVNTDGDTVEVGWADTLGTGFTGPGTFATCTFISTSGVPVPEDFAVEVLDCSGDPPPSPCAPTPEIGVAVGACSPVAAVCGNAVVEAGESCDDGNVLAGDGCNSGCVTEGTTTTTTVPVTTTTVPVTTTLGATTTTLPVTTTSTISTTSTSTTSTTIAESFAFSCTVSVGVTSNELLGSLKWEIDYSALDGEFGGSRLAAQCTSLVTGASKSFFDDEVKRVLRESVISLAGFAAPLAIATCTFETNDNSVAPPDFPLAVLDATTPDLVLVTPTVVVSSVACVAADGAFARDFAPVGPGTAPKGPIF